MFMKLLGTLAVVVVLVFSARVGTAAVVGVAMGDNFFNPLNVVISPGDRVVWTNFGNSTHDSTGPTNLWVSGDIAPNRSNPNQYGFTFTNLGYYPYRCVRHASSRQTGTVSVVQISLASVNRTPTNAQFEIRGGRQGLKAAVDVGGTLGSWSPLVTNGFPQSGTLRFTNNAPPATNRFYRARALP